MLVRQGSKTLLEKNQCGNLEIRKDDIAEEEETYRRIINKLELSTLPKLEIKEAPSEKKKTFGKGVQEVPKETRNEKKADVQDRILKMYYTDKRKPKEIVEMLEGEVPIREVRNILYRNSVKFNP